MIVCIYAELYVWIIVHVIQQGGNHDAKRLLLERPIKIGLINNNIILVIDSECFLFSTSAG